MYDKRMSVHVPEGAAVNANDARYCDYYWRMTYKDFLAHEAAGTLPDPNEISARTEPIE